MVDGNRTEIREELRDHYAAALKGREYWLQIKETCHFRREDGLILCAVEDPEWLQEVARWLPEFAGRKHFGCTLVLSTARLPSMSGKEEFHTECVVIEKEKMDCLLKYYRLTPFAGYVYVISLEQPFGNDFMIGHKGITIGDWLRNFG